MKVLDWSFKGYEGKHVICNYITHRHFDNVFRSFDTVDEAVECMDDMDLWDDYYVYEIREDGFAYAPDF